MSAVDISRFRSSMLTSEAMRLVHDASQSDLVGSSIVFETAVNS